MKDHAKGFLKLVQDAKSRVRETNVQEVHKRLQQGDQFHLIDVREESEWNAGHLPGAIQMGKGIIERDIEKKIPDQNTEIILYCGGGFRSALAAEKKKKNGIHECNFYGWWFWRLERSRLSTRR